MYSNTPRRSRLDILNAVLSQAGWWICVLSAHASPLIAPLLVTSFVVLVHFTFISKHRGRDVVVLLAVTSYGCVVDTLFISKGIYILASSELVAPVWLLCLWALFALNLDYALSWLKTRLGAACALGAFFGPLSYAAGSNFHLLTLKEPKWESLLYSSLLWAISTPLLFAILKRFNSPPGLRASELNRDV